MKLTEERIRSFTTQEYLKHRKEIQYFYMFKTKVKKRSDFKRENQFIHYTNQIYWKTRPEDYRYLDEPWLKFRKNAIQRCSNPNATKYINYGGRGICYLLTNEELQKLWFRDNAWGMKQPSLARNNSKKNYIYDNCQFLEMIDNINKK